MRNFKLLSIQDLCTIRDAFEELDVFNLINKEESLTWTCVMDEIESRIENKVLKESLK